MDKNDDNVAQFLEKRRQLHLLFKEALDKVLAGQHVDISQEAAFYLSVVFVRGFETDPHQDPKSISERYLSALNDERATDTDFRKIGDASLIMTGIWWQSVIRSLININYYMDIGSRSYQKVSESSPENLADLFEELSENFRRSVNILIEATQLIFEASMTNENILKIYEAWLETHNPFLEKKLRKLNIPIDLKPRKQ
ncbi:MAG: hypothetical protein Q8R55_07880 [Candidatus Taylorbacteria bacterium]|nr:hypothetical protein [Candidatus Taylorbacteria bacterium]